MQPEPVFSVYRRGTTLNLMKNFKAIYQNVIIPFAVFSYGFIVPVLIGFFIAATFEMPKLLVMLMMFGLAVLLYVDLIRSYENKKCR